MTIRKFTGKKLPLSNEGQLSLFFIGVGSAFSKKHYQTNLLVIKGGTHVLVDCGTKTPQALFELGRSISDIKSFLITHSHADHIGGLEEAMLVNRYLTRKKPDIIVDRIYQHILWDHSLRGAQDSTKNGRVWSSLSEICGMFITLNGLNATPEKPMK